MDRPLSTAEVSAETGIPVPTLRWFRHQGIGPRSYRLGRGVVYDRVDVETWRAAKKAATSSGGTSEVA